ncbi:uncharacterized protein BJ171DRAFT_517045 [Polychytrium aggregatum]|uniref:uncharacterized protein n=1 Tax=Polychytrium aggregatum TaxID=110093 RepID=UPI0022FE0C68|nr:uncharacterized protein BJ171DRAFT_517045 [Polychytrium aggregatum]KAI9199782.1 hypothetical protein BJ171DRAFT_517045 [Polychytrium aggregatum]
MNQSNACYNCNTQPCTNFGSCDNNLCSCPVGFGGQSCASPACGSPNTKNALRPLLSSPSSVCACDDGFAGLNCNVCLRDNVCVPPALGSNVVCNSGPRGWQRIYSSCQVIEPMLENLYPLNSQATIERYISNSSAFLSLWYQNQEQFFCSVWNCNQVRNGTLIRYDCPSVQCGCYPGAAFCGGPGTKFDLTSLIAQASNGQFYMTCPLSSPANCSVGFSVFDVFFPNGFTLKQCVHGECGDPSTAPPDVDVATVNQLTAGQIAGFAVGGALLLAIIAGLLIGFRSRAIKKKEPLAPPSKGCNLTFSNVYYTVGSKMPLKGINGQALPGRLLAIMGPSGSGKSTLLDILGGKRKSGSVSASISVDNALLGAYTDIPEVATIGFVDQDDALMETLTVRETLEFSANLRLPESIPWDTKKSMIDDVLRDLGLESVAHSRIGGAYGRSISGGEKRRVSIGVELVTSPGILFLDEPTSGLDSYNAHLVVQTLHNLAVNHGKTIVFSIHQPRSDIYKLFHDVLILAAGDCVYFGPADRAEAHFETPCPEGYNVADHLLDLAIAHSSSEVPSTISTEQDGSTRAISTLFLKLRKPTTSNGRQLELKPAAAAATTAESNPIVHSAPKNAGAVPKGHLAKTSFLTQWIVLLERSMKNLIRRPWLCAAHILVAAVLGTFIGGLYYKSQFDLAGIQNRIGSIFFLMALVGFSSLSAIGSFADERLLYIRERANGFYGALPFFLTKMVMDLIPLRIIPVLIMGTIAYFMMGFQTTADHFGRYTVIMVLLSAECALFCLIIAVLMSDVGMANLVGAILMLFELMFTGSLLNQTEIPGSLGWIRFLSIFKYAYEALAVNEIAGLQIQDNISGANINVSASVVLIKFGFDINSYYTNLIVGIGVTAAFLAILAVLFRYALQQKK